MTEVLITRRADMVAEADLLARVREAVGEAGSAQVVGPGVMRFLSWDGSSLADEQGRNHGVEDYFEARVFSSAAEVRAVRSGESWRVAELIEGAGGLPVDRFSTRAMLLGQSDGSREVDGWTKFSSLRMGEGSIPSSRPVGAIWVPAELEGLGAVDIVEYRTTSTMGNVYLLADRMAGFVSLDDGGGNNG